MPRIALSDANGDSTANWYDPAKCQEWDEASDWDGSNHISRATGSQWNHEVLYRTPSGNYIVHAWSQWQGSRDTHTRISREDACAWLVKNRYEELPADLAELAAAAEV